MVNEKHLARMLHKATRLETTYGRLLFSPVCELALTALETDAHTYAPPESGYAPIRRGDKWGHEWGSLWLRGVFTVPEELGGTALYLLPRLGGWEGFLYLAETPHAIFTNKYTVDTHGNHYAARLTAGADAGADLPFFLEYYAGHYIPGNAPFEDGTLTSFSHTYESVSVCTKNQAVSDFLFDLKTINALVRALPADSFRRGDLVRALGYVVQTVFEDPACVSPAEWEEALASARAHLAPVLRAQNAASAPEVTLVGHSHMDTAWLWPVSETVRKCARTYANALALMEEYPEFRFIQSSAYHTELIRRHYPALFSRIVEAAARGQYEPVGAVWVECDCNMVSGESLARQFLWGQTYFARHFGRRHNSFWLPDTFGYSAAIPQIMRQAGVEFFYTTKLSWNDTNLFPHDTFFWEGIDGSRVLTHFNATHCGTDPETLLKYTRGSDSPEWTQEIRHKSVSRRKLIAYGLGDGGGGPEFEMVEQARRVADLDGCPRARHGAVEDFGPLLLHEAEANGAPVHAGELYLELHRGTLTNRHEIKRNNRKAEIALHDLELLTVLRAIQTHTPADDSAIRPHMETLLKNQFHDILPGSSIERVHTESIAEMHAMREAVASLTEQTFEAAPSDGFTAWNPLGFWRADTVYLPGKFACGQSFTDVFGREVTAVEGVRLAPMGCAPVDPAATPQDTSAPFTVTENGLETLFYIVEWDENGGFASLFDKRADRELRSGLPLGTLLLAEDVPYMWDNWDVDPDAVFRETATLLSRETVSVGASQARFRLSYRLSALSTLTQDVVFYAGRPEIEFHTRIDWHDRHRFLKAAFDTDIRATYSTHEIQFGNLKRPTTRNDSREQAMFEVCSHKYTDLSEPRYGCAVLSDCKYGVSVSGGSIRLSLHKAGCRPDETGDSGLHDVTYIFLPHEGALSAETVVHAAYCLNSPVRVFAGGQDLPEAPLTVSSPHVLVEAVKPLHETAERAMVVRLYECEGARAVCHLRLAPYVTRAVHASLLEEAGEEAQTMQVFRPFEIKTLILYYQ